jgi:hypothetical protein
MIRYSIFNLGDVVKPQINITEEYGEAQDAMDQLYRYVALHGTERDPEEEYPPCLR